MGVNWRIDNCDWCHRTCSFSPDGRMCDTCWAKGRRPGDKARVMGFTGGRYYLWSLWLWQVLMLERLPFEPTHPIRGR